MKISEIRTALTELGDSVGPSSMVDVVVKVDHLLGCIYPCGVGSSKSGSDPLFIRRSDDDIAALLAEMHAKWSERAGQFERDTVRSMALEIIRITADRGRCIDIDLRAGKFSQNDIDRYGERACVDATQIASNGPFSIVSSGLLQNAA